LSFLQALSLRQKRYALFSAITVALVSLLSAGVPRYESYSYPYLPQASNVSGVVVSQPLPLSFPFYAYINRTSVQSFVPPREDVYESYLIELATFRLPQSYYRTVMDVYQNIGAESPTKFLYLDWGDYLLYYMFFLTVNLAGAIIGYWISRTQFIEQWLKKRKPSVTASPVA